MKRFLLVTFNTHLAYEDLWSGTVCTVGGVRDAQVVSTGNTEVPGEKKGDTLTGPKSFGFEVIRKKEEDRVIILFVFSQLYRESLDNGRDRGGHMWSFFFVIIGLINRTNFETY